MTPLKVKKLWGNTPISLKTKQTVNNNKNVQPNAKFKAGV